MNPFYLIIGALVGGALGKWSGVVGGALFGYLFGELASVRQRLAGLEKEVTWLRKRQPASTPSATAPPLQPAAPIPMPAVSPKPGPSGPMAEQSALPAALPHSPVVDTSWREETAQEDFIFFEPTPAPTAPGQEEKAGEPALDIVGRLFSGENLLVKLGVVILFFGVSFLLKYAAQHGLFPLEMRLAGAALGGTALIATGWRLRLRRPIYAQVIQGGGVGIIYLTIFAAMRLYHLLPTVAGFSLLVAVCALAATLAILQDSPSLAVLGSAGGFIAPELASIGSGNPVVLFSYYAVLNGGIVAVAWFRAWRGLNLLGFLFTFIASASWGGRFYHPDYFASVEPFLVLFFLLYTGVALLSAERQPAGKRGYLDGTMVFGTPITAFALQAGLIHNYEYGLAWSAFALGLFYLALAGVLFRFRPLELRSLSDAYLAFGIAFLTLSIPLAFDGRWTSAAWAMEGAAVIWAGLRQDRQLAGGFGYLLLVGSGGFFLADMDVPLAGWPVLNSHYLGCLMISGTALFASWLLNRESHKLAKWESGIQLLFFVWGMLWWLGGGLQEIDRHLASELCGAAWLTFVAVSCGTCQLLRRPLVWPLLNYPARGLVPVLAVFTAAQVLNGTAHPAAHGGLVAWPLAFAICYGILWAQEDEPPQLPGLLHAVPLWLFAWLAAWELHWQVNYWLSGMESWAMTSWGVIPALLGLGIVLRGESIDWPIARHRDTYLGLVSVPLLMFAWLWSLVANLTQAVNPWPLPYLPLINPIDGATLLVLVTLAAWYRTVSGRVKLPASQLLACFAATVFFWLNAMLLRSIHHWGGVAFNPAALWDSMLVQAALSLFWSLLALVSMTVATRRGSRPIWFSGALLLGLVVGKLFLVDLASSGTVERIVSFVGVGILLLVIGWFSPVPPRCGGVGRKG